MGLLSYELGAQMRGADLFGRKRQELRSACQRLEPGVSDPLCDELQSIANGMLWPILQIRTSAE
jgi:hypothetical protein